MEKQRKRHWKITVKERATGRIFTPEYIGYSDREEMIDFFGLENPDVEWYRLEEVPCGENREKQSKQNKQRDNKLN